MSTIQIIDKETLSERKYPLKYYRFEQPDETGKFFNHEREVYLRPDAVAVLLIDKVKKKLMLTKQFRLPAFLNGSESGYLIEACAGVMDEAETPEQTAIREVNEETGYTIQHLEKAGTAYTSPNATTELMHLFTAEYSSKTDHPQFGGLKDEGESIELIELSFKDAKEQLLAGAFRDTKTILLLQHFFLHQRE